MQSIVIYLCVSLVLFILGIFITVSKRNAIHILIGIELLLLGALLNFVAFARFVEGGVRGQIVALFVVVLIVSETLMALAVFVNIYRHKRDLSVDEMNSLKG